MAISTFKNSELNKVIGTGINYPVEFIQNKNDQLLRTVTDVEAINQSIRIIFETAIGERYNNPNFGSAIKYLVFEPNDVILKDALYFTITEALTRWEKRVTLKDIGFLEAEELLKNNSNLSGNLINPADAENTLFIVVSYTINQTHQEGSFVYPFVKNPMPANQLIQKTALFGMSPYTAGFGATNG